MATELTPAEQYAQVRTVIQAIAARCDGAQSLDMMGFNGVDTHYGRRVAAMPGEWTPEINEESAHIVLKYREQGIKWTGIDVATLPVVIAAQDNGTNYTAREQARQSEKRAKHLSARVIDVLGDRLTVAWANRDPDFDTFLKLVRDLPGRRWDSARRVNVVDVSPQVEVFVQEYDFTMTPAAQALLEARKVTLNTDNRPDVQVQARSEASYPVYLLEGRIIIKTNLTAPGQPASDAVRELPGRSFVRSLYANSADPSPAVVAFATRFHLEISPAALKACEAAQAALQAVETADLAQADLDTVMNAVSRCGSPEELPAAFVLMLKEIL